IWQVDPLRVPAALQSRLPPGALDEDSPHGLRRGREEVAAAVELLVPDEPQVRLVDECRGLERLPRLLPRQAQRGELPQLVVDEWEERGRSLWVAGRDGGQDLGDVGHVQTVTAISTNHKRPAAHFFPGIHFGHVGSFVSRSRKTRAFLYGTSL